MNYRPDIDGLRAVAVMAVVLFHAGLPFVPGGFTGVDIFFVISGYLITGIVMRELEQGHFSIAGFYERRVRRIFPALFAVCAVTAAAAFFILLPEDFYAFGQSLIATIFFASNMWFWSQTGYFDTDAVTKPLLHTWSLGVEEQFYLFFPLILYGIYRFQKNYLEAWIIVGVVLSFIISIWGTHHVAGFTFYALPMRAWELMIGSFLAVTRFAPPQKRVIKNALGALGLLLICYGIFMLDEESRFPGANALYPCLGAGILIWIGKGTAPGLATQILSLKPFVAIGLISYSLYLWHWPLLALSHYYTLLPLPLPFALLMVVLSVVLGFLSWRFVEQPFRNHKLAPLLPRQRLFQGAALGMGLFLLMGAGIIYAKGLPQRFPQQAYTLLFYQNFDKKELYEQGRCFMGSERFDESFDPVYCLHRDPQKKNVLLIGDSHAAHYIAALRTIYPDVNFLHVSAAGCVPVKDVVTKDNENCYDFHQLVFKGDLLTHLYDAVIVSGRWGGDRADDITDENYAATLKELKKYQQNIYLIGPSPSYRTEVSRILFRYPEIDQNASLFMQFFDPRVPELDARLHGLAALADVHYLSGYDALCKNGICPLWATEQIPMNWDDDHFTQQGAERLVAVWKEQGDLRF